MEAVDPPRSRLSEYLELVGWKPEQLAREINRRYGSNTISSKAPYAWLARSTPRAETAEAVAQILSAQLSQQVSVGDIWSKLAPQIPLREAAPAIPEIPWNNDGTLAASHRLADLLALETRGVRPLAGSALAAPVLDWVLAEPATHHEGKTGRSPIVPATLHALVARVGQLRTLDDEQGGPIVLDWVTHDLAWVASLIRDEAYDPATGVALHHVLAELAQLGGWLANDQDRPVLGQNLLLLGLHAAHTSGDRELGANIVSCLSYQTAWSGQQSDALRLVRAARKGLGGPQTGPVHALLATREARAHAQLADADSCARALDQATAALDTPADSLPPSWAYWINEAVLAADAGRAWLELGRPGKAEEHLTRGLALFGDAQPRNRMLHHASLAEARISLGDVDGAVDAASASLALSEHLVSQRARTRLRNLRDTFTGLGSRIARDVVERADHILQ